jgi:hypothetical protein
VINYFNTIASLITGYARYPLLDFGSKDKSKPAASS